MTASASIQTLAPEGPVTAYDRDHATVYLRLLDAETAGADWRVAAEIVLGLGANVTEADARRIHDSHLARAHWLVDGGYAELLKLPFDPGRDG